MHKEGYYSSGEFAKKANDTTYNSISIVVNCPNYNSKYCCYYP